MTARVACFVCGCIGTRTRVAQRIAHGTTPLWRADRCRVDLCSCHAERWDVIHLRAIPEDVAAELVRPEPAVVTPAERQAARDGSADYAGVR